MLKFSFPAVKARATTTNLRRKILIGGAARSLLQACRWQ